MSLVRNERLKLTAGWLNALANLVARRLLRGLQQ
jgi:hypothetical protein